ncbi:hypothetical protein [Frankia sp. CiP3]|uniref:hypothetical protein n=1 Tax=Frankia sp. CiP3 TaxID=2880971 RepID=UPI001EF5795C|nr:MULTISPECIES: hypothetical protein [unclassified Frankia]
MRRFIGSAVVEAPARRRAVIVDLSVAAGQGRDGRSVSGEHLWLVLRHEPAEQFVGGEHLDAGGRRSIGREVLDVPRAEHSCLRGDGRGQDMPVVFVW